MYIEVRRICRKYVDGFDGESYSVEQRAYTTMTPDLGDRP